MFSPYKSGYICCLQNKQPNKLIEEGRCSCGSRRSVVQIPLEEEKYSPFRFFFRREPLNHSLSEERTFFFNVSTSQRCSFILLLQSLYIATFYNHKLNQWIRCLPLHDDVIAESMTSSFLCNLHWPKIFGLRFLSCFGLSFLLDRVLLSSSK